MNRETIKGIIIGVISSLIASGVFLCYNKKMALEYSSSSMDMANYMSVLYSNLLFMDLYTTTTPY